MSFFRFSVANFIFNRERINKMTDVVAVFLEMFGWSNDMITIADVINNIVRLAIGIGIFVFIMKMPAIFLGRHSRLL